MIVLDTDVSVEILDRRPVKGDEALRRLRNKGQDIAITVINLQEVLYGLAKYATHIREVLLLLVLDFIKLDAELSELELKAELSGIQN